MATESRLGSRIAAALGRPCDPAGLGALRILLGLVLFGAVVRFAANGWIHALYVAPGFHFPYDGFGWVRVLPPVGMYLLFAAMGLAAASLALGLLPRAASLCFCLAFTYVELIDKATYLNHYYLVSLLTLLLACVPSGAWASVASKRSAETASVPAWGYALLRFQIGIVYVFAGLAKLDSDWLLRAEPLKTWLYASADLPLLGPLLARPEAAYAMSWGGAAFDLAVVPLLLWQRSRAYAYAAAIVFHALVGLLFPIGMFPWIMLVAATAFFDPSWPRRVLRLGVPSVAAHSARPLPAPVVALLAAYVALQIALPLRFLAYPGSVNWTEQGFRFAWRVMLIEKTGQVEYEVVTGTPERRFDVDPRAELTELQYRMLSTQPDMIHDYALALAARFRSRGYTDVRVYARVFASLNGRPSEPLVDPSVDLASEPRSLAPKRWISLSPAFSRRWPMDPPPSTDGARNGTLQRLDINSRLVQLVPSNELSSEMGSLGTPGDETGGRLADSAELDRRFDPPTSSGLGGSTRGDLAAAPADFQPFEPRANMASR